MRIALLLLLCTFAGAQDVKPLPEQAQNKLLKAQHVLDEVQGHEKDLQIQFDATSNTLKQIQTAYATAQEQEKAAQKGLDDAKASALKDAGLDAAKFDLDMKTLAPVAKPEPPKVPK